MGLNDIAMLISFAPACVCYHQVGGFCRRSMLFNRIIWPFLRTVFVVRHIKKQAEMNMEAADVYMRFRRSQENGDIINITLI